MAKKQYFNDLVIENAKIIFRNFKGEKDRYNRTGKKQFTVVIEDPEMAQQLSDDGWNIGILKSRDPNEPIRHKLPVEVRFDVAPPKILLITESSRTYLDEKTVGALDFADIKMVDLIINPYPWEIENNDGIRSGIKAYLKAMYVTIKEDKLAAKYSEFDELDKTLPFEL